MCDEAWEERRKRLEDEMQEHIDLETQENIDAGMSPLEARQAAMRKFGSVAPAADQSREAWGWLWLERLWQDVRFALRSFRKNAGFTVVALLSLMLGIGASIALFSVVYGVLIAPYPYAKPESDLGAGGGGPQRRRPRLALVFTARDGGDSKSSPPLLTSWRPASIPSC